MRWDDLFADLEGQAQALETAQRSGEIGERARIELSSVALADRFRAALGVPVRLNLAGGLLISGVLSRIGADWLLVEEPAGREALVALSAIRSAAGLGRHAAAPGTAPVTQARLTMRSALRGVAHDRSAVRAHLVDGEVLAATVDRVGADFVELARHPAGEARRRGEVRDVVLVAFPALAAVRRDVL